MENEQTTMPVQSCEKCGGRWHHKHHGWHHGGCRMGLWAVGWLFTIGFLKLAFWKGVLAIVVWPYFLGVFFAR
ncbi:MAG TPA: hypothetical protein VMU12_02370 [Candidatus Paceibacterota bacterium]|nr:hypothetical protein [Candidatus Paceibacterota bacterium]